MSATSKIGRDFQNKKRKKARNKSGGHKVWLRTRRRIRREIFNV